jgi:dipeptide/tripeptide permease
MTEQTRMKFPAVFWYANLTELFERAAYYSMASFVVIYLGQLGLGTYWPAMLNTLLWFLIYFLANPLVIVCFQLLVTKLFGRLRPIRSMIIGTLIIGAAMALNLIPLLVGGELRESMGGWLPVGSFIVVASIALGAFAELFTSARMYEYVGALAPRGQESLFLGYANLPLAFGSLAGGPVGALIFNEVMARGATRRPDGLLDLLPDRNAAGWLILMAVGFVSALSMWVFNRWLEKQERKEQAPAV